MADGMLEIASNMKDVKLLAEFHAQKVKFHHDRTEYIFEDGTSISL